MGYTASNIIRNKVDYNRKYYFYGSSNISGDTSNRYNIDDVVTNLTSNGGSSGGGGNVLNVAKSSSSEEILQPVTPISAITTPPGIYNVFCRIFVSGVTDSETGDKVYIEGTPDSVNKSVYSPLFMKEYNGLVCVNGDSSIRYRLYTRFNDSGGICYLNAYYEQFLRG